MDRFEQSLESQMQRLTQLRRTGKWAEAERLNKELLVSHPQEILLLNELGNLLLSQGRPKEAQEWLEKSLRLSADQFIPLSDYATALGLLGRLDASLDAFDRALTLKPDDAATHYNRGLILERQNRPEKALASYDLAIAFDPSLSPAHNNRGNVLKGFNRLEDALECYNRALALDDANADAHSNRGVVLQELGRLEEALASYDTAIARRPGFAMAYKNKAILKLLRGEFEEGWQLFEWRWKADLQGEFRNFAKPLWLGDEPLIKRVLLVQAEQGFGDILQFCRYVPMLKGLVGKIILEAPKPLVSILATLPSDVTVVERGQPLPAFDQYCPLLSLPLAFKTTVKNIPAKVPYLSVVLGKQSAWRQRLGPKKKTRIGLAWSGKEQYIHDTKRSIPLERLKPLLKLPLEFHSLQKDYRPKEETLLSGFPQIQNHKSELGDFSDTAALVSEMDLVVSADTSVAHLAGALNKPFWVMLPFVPNYRWLLDRPDSPWYPSATLFRQPALGDWEAVIRQVVSRLGNFEFDKES